MFKVIAPKTILAFSFLLLATVACTDSSDKTGSAPALGAALLQYVPADAPYVFAVLDPLPDEVADKLEPKIDAILRSYAEIMTARVEAALAIHSESAEGAGKREEMSGTLEALGSLMSIEGLRGAGIQRDSEVVLYGVGLLPVLRMTLSDGDLMDAAIARLEEMAKGGMSVATIAGQPYRYAGDDEGRVVVAVIGDELVLSVVPADSPDDLLKSVLGLTLPANNIADSGELQKIIDNNGYLTHSVGLIDFERIVATFLDDQSGVNEELLARMGYDGSILDDVCRSEIREMSGIFPRIVTGYTEISVDRFVSNTILEARSDIAAGLATLPAPVPGLGSDQGGLLAFGLSVDLPAAREFYTARLDALQADPYECELFAELQAGLEQGRTALNQPIPPIAYSFKGFLAVVEDIKGMDLASNQPPTSADLRVLVATDNAAGLLAMGAMFSPEIAALDIKPDGKPVRFELQRLAGAVDAAFVAMTDTALAFSIGQGVETRLGDMFSAAVNEPHPFTSMEMDGARYYDFISKTMVVVDEGEDPAPEELKAAIGETMVAFGAAFSRMRVRVEVTERGIEILSTVELSE